MKRYSLRYSTVLLLLFSLSAVNASALTVNAVTTIHNDPNNYLGLNGLINIGDSASGQFDITGTAFFCSLFLPDQAEHILSLNDASTNIVVNGISISEVGATNYGTVILNNVLVGDYGVGDFYSFAHISPPPDPAYLGLVWMIGLFDETGTAHNSTDFYNLTSPTAFNRFLVTAYFTTDEPGQVETLFLAEAQVVPLPASAWFFCVGNRRTDWRS